MRPLTAFIRSLCGLQYFAACITKHFFKFKFLKLSLFQKIGVLRVSGGNPVYQENALLSKIPQTKFVPKNLNFASLGREPWQPWGPCWEMHFVVSSLTATSLNNLTLNILEIHVEKYCWKNTQKMYLCFKNTVGEYICCDAFCGFLVVAAGLTSS